MTTKKLAKREEGRPARLSHRTWAVPAVDVYENADAFLVAADLPGFKKDDVKIEYENGELRFEAHRPDFDDASDKAPGPAPWAHDYRRTFRISSRVDAGAIAAALNRGVLSIHLPKAESEKPRHIAVTVQ